MPRPRLTAGKARRPGPGSPEAASARVARSARATAAAAIAGLARTPRAAGHAGAGPAPRCAVVAWNMRALLACVQALASANAPRLVFQHNDLLPGPMAIGAVVRAAAVPAQMTVCLSGAIPRDLDPAAVRGVPVVPAGVDLERFSPSARRPPIRRWFWSWARSSPGSGRIWPSRSRRGSPTSSAARREAVGAAGGALVASLSQRAGPRPRGAMSPGPGPFEDPLPALQGAAAPAPLRRSRSRTGSLWSRRSPVACRWCPGGRRGDRDRRRRGCLHLPGDAGAAALVLRDVLARRDERRRPPPRRGALRPRAGAAALPELLAAA